MYPWVDWPLGHFDNARWVEWVDPITVVTSRMARLVLRPSLPLHGPIIFWISTPFCPYLDKPIFHYVCGHSLWLTHTRRYLLWIKKGSIIHGVEVT